MRRLPPKPSKIVESKAGFQMTGHRTHAGHPIECHSRKVIEAIENEYRTRGKLDAVNHFGFYSAFSTYRDFIVGKEIVTRDFSNDLAKSDHFIVKCPNPFCTWSKIEDQQRTDSINFLKILGLSHIASNQQKKYQTQLHRYLSTLEPHVISGLVLMNGMFGVPVSIFVLFINEKFSADEIAATLTMHYQIDDREGHAEARRIISGVTTINQFITMMTEDRVRKRKSAS